MTSEPSAKVIVLGNSSVGKTSIILRFYKGMYYDENQPTIGASYVKKQVKVNNKTIELHLWDTAGQERFRSIIPMYMRGCSAVLFICSMDSPESVQELDVWKDILEKNQPGIRSIFVVLNKCDLNDQSLYKEALEYSKKNDFLFYQTSAKTGMGIEELFAKVAEEIVNSEDFNYTFKERTDVPIEKKTTREDPDEKNSSGCC